MLRYANALAKCAILNEQKLKIVHTIANFRTVTECVSCELEANYLYIAFLEKICTYFNECIKREGTEMRHEYE